MEVEIPRQNENYTAEIISNRITNTDPISRVRRTINDTIDLDRTLNSSSNSRFVNNFRNRFAHNNTTDGGKRKTTKKNKRKRTKITKRKITKITKRKRTKKVK